MLIVSLHHVLVDDIGGGMSQVRFNGLLSITIMVIFIVSVTNDGTTMLKDNVGC